MPIIKISGAKGAGKSTALQAIKAHFAGAFTYTQKANSAIVMATSYYVETISSASSAADAIQYLDDEGYERDLNITIIIEDGGERPTTAGFLAQELAQRFPSAFIYYAVEGE